MGGTYETSTDDALGCAALPISSYDAGDDGNPKMCNRHPNLELEINLCGGYRADDEEGSSAEEIESEYHWHRT
jgi:hypothetical protein